MNCPTCGTEMQGFGPWWKCPQCEELINLVEEKRLADALHHRRQAKIGLPELPKPDNISFFVPGEPCKHMLAVFDVMRAGKLKFDQGSYPEDDPSIQCSTCLTWDPCVGVWRGLESNIPPDLDA